MVGPYLIRNIQAELEPLDDSQDMFGQAAAMLRKKGYDVHYAEWLITGKPRVVLLESQRCAGQVAECCEIPAVEKSWNQHSAG